MRSLLQESVERLFADLVTPELLRSAEAGHWPDALWAEIEGLGLPLAAVPENQGGAGASWSDIVVVIKACGASPAPVPLPETIAANALLADAGLSPREEGPGAFAVGSADRPLRDLPWGRHIAWLALHEVERGVLSLHTLHGATIEPGENRAGEPRDSVLLALGSRLAETPWSAEPDAIKTMGARLRAAQIAGALDRLTEMSAAYANERIQFGRPIGKFQAMQQSLALLATQAAAAVAAAETAFISADGGDETLAIGSAKAVTGEAAGRGAAIAHAVHGALGFTHEHSLHFLTRRLWAWREEFGSDTYWAEQIGRLIATEGGAGLWPSITAVLKDDMLA
jgi:acyl-CoA dehydrogenase